MCTFLSSIQKKKESTLLESPVPIGKELKLIISRYVMTLERFKSCVCDALNSGIWSYTDSWIDEGDKIDEPFPTPIKYVAGNDPTGSLYGQTIPLKNLFTDRILWEIIIFSKCTQKPKMLRNS